MEYYNGAKEFAEKHIAPIARELSKKVEFPAGIFEELKKEGYLKLLIFKELGALGAVNMMSMSDMLPYIEDKKAYEDMLSILDVPANSIKNAICAGKLPGTSQWFWKNSAP